MSDLRSLFSAIAVIRDNAPTVTVIPASTTTDPASGDTIDVPAQTIITPPTGDLPAELCSPDGTTVDISAAVGALWGAVWQLQNAERHTAVGRITLTSGVYLTGDTVDLDITWDDTPLATPQDGLVVVMPALAWLGRTTARVKPGTTTDTGCTITVSVLASVTPTSGSPITYEAQASYQYFPEAP